MLCAFRLGRCHGVLARVRFDGFVVEVELHELLAPGGPLPEVVVEGDAGEFPLEVEFVFLAVGGVVQDGVDVMENVLFGDGSVGSGVGDYKSLRDFCSLIVCL